MYHHFSRLQLYLKFRFLHLQIATEIEAEFGDRYFARRDRWPLYAIIYTCPTQGVISIDIE